MAELGEAAPAMHTQAGRDARDLGFERLYAVGPLSAEAAAAFDGGARHHGDLSSLLVSLQRDLAETGAGVCVLVKGSRSARMERVVAALESTAGSG
jgi:UDP-N-acetylmuramoyl-tripeptide--D-alanyl-D-alanine ligase